VITNASLHERRMAAVPRGVSNATAIYAARAENAELWDVEGRRYIDFAGGIAVLNTGHRHPKVMAAAGAQAERFTHTSFQVVPYEPYVALAERLNALAPGDFAKKTVFFTTGAEAIENAVKIARAATGRPGAIAFTGGYHGRTLLTLGLTGKISPYKLRFGPFPTDIFRAPFPNALHGISVQDALAALDLLFRTDADPERIAAMVIEPVQGEGGYYIAPFEFLRELRRICDERGILLIADEIQSGFARTGAWFAIEHSGVVPDLIAVAKSLAGGFPLAGVIGRAEIMDAVPPGGLGGTYGGNPVACAAALAAVQAIEEEGLLERSRDLGNRMVARLKEIAASNWLPFVSEVRGLGAMVSFELVQDRATGAPNPELTVALTRKAAENGLVLLSCGLYGNVVRIMVPLTASDAIVDEGMDIIERSLREIVEDSGQLGSAAAV
jgi:4-aminobutyrate aminotransferase/(S)-3-amino-2-methylpropionate transaminase